MANGCRCCRRRRRRQAGRAANHAHLRAVRRSGQSAGRFAVAGLVRRMTVGAVTDQDAATLMTPMRAAIAALDQRSRWPNDDMAQVMADASAPQRFSTILLVAFASGALLRQPSASTGCSRSASPGGRVDRRATGPRATRREILASVRQGMTLTRLARTRDCRCPRRDASVRRLLYRPSRWIVTFASVPGILAVVRCLRAICRRRAGVEPMAALRAE